MVCRRKIELPLGIGSIAQRSVLHAILVTICNALLHTCQEDILLLPRRKAMPHTCSPILWDNIWALHPCPITQPALHHITPIVPTTQPAILNLQSTSIPLVEFQVLHNCYKHKHSSRLQHPYKPQTCKSSPTTIHTTHTAAACLRTTQMKRTGRRPGAM